MPNDPYARAPRVVVLSCRVEESTAAEVEALRVRIGLKNTATYVERAVREQMKRDARRHNGRPFKESQLMTESDSTTTRRLAL